MPTSMKIWQESCWNEVVHSRCTKRTLCVQWHHCWVRNARPDVEIVVSVIVCWTNPSRSSVGCGGGFYGLWEDLNHWSEMLHCGEEFSLFPLSQPMTHTFQMFRWDTHCGGGSLVHTPISSNPCCLPGASYPTYLLLNAYVARTHCTIMKAPIHTHRNTFRCQS